MTNGFNSRPATRFFFSASQLDKKKFEDEKKELLA